MVQFPALPMRKHWLLILQTSLSAFLLWRIFGNEALRAEAGRLLTSADPRWLAAGLGTAFLCELLCAVRWWIMLRLFGVPVSFARTCAFAGAGLFFSLGLPGSGGGDAFRIIYVMRLYPGQKLRAALSVVADRLCGLAALLAAVVLPLARSEMFAADPLSRATLGAAAGTLLLAALLVFLWWLTTLPRLHARWLPYVPKSIRPQADQLGQIFPWLSSHPRLVAAAVLVSGAALAAHFTTYFFSAKSFALDLKLIDLFTVMPVVDTLTMLPVTLFGLGLRETLFEYLLGGLFQIAPGAATLASLGGFGLQAVVGLCGGLLVPFTFYRKDC
jgi:uncharacterized membrane protein YbhN (UPF0104 family)